MYEIVLYKRTTLCLFYHFMFIGDKPDKPGFARVHLAKAFQNFK